MSPELASKPSAVARVAAPLALAAAAVLLALLLLGGADTHRYKLRFQTAGQLVEGNDVQVGGRRIGSVAAIELTRDNQAEVTIDVEEPYAPLHEGTRATVRLTSLSGVANRYVALAPGPDNGREIEDGAILAQDATTSVVDLDQLFATLDAPARKDLQKLVQGFATQYDGVGEEANEAARYFNPALSSTSALLRELSEDESALTRFVVDSSRAVTALAERRDDLAALVGNADATAGAIASENESLSAALALLPGTLRKANTTFVNLRSALTDLDELVAASKPATRELAPFLRSLRPLVAAARPTVADLRTLVSAPGPGNDLVEATRKLPRLAKIATPVLARARRTLARSQPVVEFIRPYTPELVGWLRDFGQGASTYDANGHYARIQPVFNAFSVADSPLGAILNAQPPEDRLKGLQSGFNERCPGAASQPPPDGSAPFTDGGKLDCNPRQVPGGP